MSYTSTSGSLCHSTDLPSLPPKWTCPSGLRCSLRIQWKQRCGTDTPHPRVNFWPCTHCMASKISSRRRACLGPLHSREAPGLLDLGAVLRSLSLRQQNFQLGFPTHSAVCRLLFRLGTRILIYNMSATRSGRGLFASRLVYASCWKCRRFPRTNKPSSSLRSLLRSLRASATPGLATFGLWIFQRFQFLIQVLDKQLYALLRLKGLKVGRLSPSPAKHLPSAAPQDAVPELLVDASRQLDKNSTRHS